MKFFAFIISFYLLGLSCLPCADKKECNVKAVQAISAATNHEQHNHSTEQCTPFCTCSCCSSSVFYQATAFLITPKAIFHSVEYPAYNSAFCPEVSFTIWQPPKIS